MPRATMAPLHLLHLEDSSTDAELVGLLIRREWPGCDIRVVTSGEDFCAALDGGKFDLILSDYTLPGFDGLRALEAARTKSPAVPFVFLSGTIGEERAVEALKRGASDYVIKDRPTRLIAAMRQALALTEESGKRREADVRLREQASLLDKARDAIIATDLEHRIAYWNASAERLYGWKAKEVFGRRLDEIGLGFDATRFTAARTQVLSSGEWRGDFRLRTREGETVLVESTWSLVMENDGRPRSILAIDTDVTEKKKLETQLLRAQRMESIGTLAGGIAHDLNNVLTPILLSIDMLAMSAHQEEDRQLIERTRESASHGAALVQQLLAFARGADAKRTRLEPAMVLAELTSLIRQSLPAPIRLLVCTEDRPTPISADTTQFKQVIINLCINARDAMPNGGTIEIVTRKFVVDATLAAGYPGVQPGPYVRVSVIDNGTGIPSGILEKIFDPFFTTKPAGKGTGLGLSMVAGIMKSHGGFVQVESEVGRGAAFHLFFPALPTGGPPVLRDAPPAATTGGGETVLLIDDEPMVRDTLKLLLQRASYQVIAAADGGAGLTAFDRNRDAIALVISDMMLPDVSGMDVVKELRRRAPRLPAIAISGMMASGAYDDLLKLEPRVQCLAKPLAPSVLLAAVRSALAAAATAKA